MQPCADELSEWMPQSLNRVAEAYGYVRWWEGAS